MRFRIGRREDVPACVDLLREHGSLPISEPLYGALPEIIVSLQAAGALAAFSVFDEETDSAFRLCAFGLTAFVDRARYVALRDRPEPHITVSLLEEAHQARSPFLNATAVRDGNSSGGLHLIVLTFTSRYPSLDRIEAQRLMPVAASAWQFSHAGFNLDGILGEVQGADTAQFMELGGWSLVDDFAEWTATHKPARPPFRFALERANVPRGAANPLALQMFHRQPPRIFFTTAEQRVLLYAMLGSSDRQVATELDLSIETVRSTWDAIYARVGKTIPLLVAGEEGASAVARGNEKRRTILEYVRQHPEELRPVNRPR